ncbi:hypothetical protein [Saccharibacillus sp. O23]|uniref:hypothetical protein n=1 Tax=Saccharibacillus sp. O23 TaxID=2009338 RepID=UPI00117AB891|nr:hypothetical protein [Saccharibacillus sp. O23]
MAERASARRLKPASDKRPRIGAFLAAPVRFRETAFAGGLFGVRFLSGFADARSFPSRRKRSFAESFPTVENAQSLFFFDPEMKRFHNCLLLFSPR